MRLFERNRSRSSAVTLPDAELAWAAQRGDKRAFVEIVARHQAMVCGIALGVLGDFGASEDAGQEAFLMAWRKIHELREPESLRAWLGQIARNAALGELRRKRGHDPLDEDLLLVDEGPRPDEAAASQEEAAMVRETLSRLPETYRAPLILYYREGKSVKAVAEALGLSEDAVKQRLARGRDLMQERMAGLIETVLGRTMPNAVFTMAIAVAIGALAAPAAVAGGGFGAAVLTGTSTAATSTTPLLTLMSTSKGLLIAAAMIAVACIPIGYQLARDPGAAGAPESVIGTAASKPPMTNPAQSFDSTLLAEWRELHAKHGTNAQAMPELYKTINGLKDAFRRQALRTALVAEWAEVDPAGGLDFFLGKGKSEDLRRQFIQEWLARNPKAAVDAVLARNDGIDRLPREFLTNVAAMLPARLAEVVSHLPKPDNYWDRNVGMAFALVAQKDLSSAIASAQSVTGANRDQALAGVANVWGQSDLKATIAWARALPEGTDREEVIRSALIGQARVNPALALESVEEVPPGGRHAYFASTTGARVLHEAAAADFGATLSWLGSHPGRFNHEDLYGLVEPVTERMNMGVGDFLSARIADGTLGALAPAVENSLLNGAAGQRAAVWDWLKSQPETEATKAIRKEVLTSAAWHEPEFALELVGELPRTAAGDADVNEIARSLFNGGNSLYRFEKLFGQSPDRLKQPLLQQAFDALYGSPVDEPRKWISRITLLPDAVQPNATEELARAWAQQAPEETVAWVASLPAGESRNGAAAGLASEWVRKDSQAANEWVSLMSQGPERDRAVAGMVPAVAEQSPHDAWHLALSISDDTQRKEAATRAAKAMASRDPGAARQWIEAGPFTAEVKAELQTALNNPIKPARWQ